MFFVAAVLALSLAACGEKPVPAPAPVKIDSAADVAARQQAAADTARAAAAKAAEPKASADSVLAAKVKAAIVATPGLKDMAMDVHASNGTVTLFGTADAEAQRRKAGEVAAGMPGVTSVKNELKIVRGS